MVDPELLSDEVALQHDEFLFELFLQFALPLERQVGGTDNENAFRESTQLKLANEQPSHYGLARTSVVCQKKTDARQLQQIVVDGFKLVR